MVPSGPPFSSGEIGPPTRTVVSVRGWEPFGYSCDTVKMGRNTADKDNKVIFNLEHQLKILAEGQGLADISLVKAKQRLLGLLLLLLLLLPYCCCLLYCCCCCCLLYCCCCCCFTEFYSVLYCVAPRAPLSVSLPRQRQMWHACLLLWKEAEQISESVPFYCCC